MRLQIIFAALILLGFSFSGAAQDAVSDQQPEQNKYRETRLFDEFGATSHCDLGARIQNLYIEVSQNSGTRGYIIIYRGADTLPAQQTEAAAQRNLNRVKDQIAFLNLNAELIELVDGGLRKNNTIWNEVWIVPKGGAIPQPTQTVEKSKLPTDKAFKVDQSYFSIYDAQIEKPDLEAPEETETPVVETPEPAEEVSEIQTEEISETETDEYSEETDPYDWISDYFAEQLRGDKNFKGVVIFYADETEYDLAKLRANIDEGMRKSSEKSTVDLSGVKVVFGGYRASSVIEFWIVPPGAKEPTPTPEEKIESEL